VATATADSDSADAIARIAKDWAAELIVVGSHSYSGLKKFGSGDVSDCSTVSAPCPLEIVRTTR
ncbi:universal stress protein, partial [Vibrio parahaemolyticus]